MADVDVEEVQRQLERDLLKIHTDSYGRGAGSARVYVNDDMVCCLLDDLELLPNEEFMISEGEGQGVVEVRSRFQQAIETTFRAAVERATGRRVISFASVTKLDPNYAVEIFRLSAPPDVEEGSG